MVNPSHPVLMKPLLMAVLFISASLAGCFSSEETATSQVEAIFDYDPDKNIRVGMDIDFDGGASLPAGASLTYKWDFDSDGSYDETGRTCLLYTSPSPRDGLLSRMPSSA